MREFEHTLLGDLLAQAINNCEYCGYGEAEDQEGETGLKVTAEWTGLPGNEENQSIMEVTILKDGVVKFSYLEPATICES